MTSATLTFSDDFNKLNLWNGTSGTWDTNYWYNTLTGNGGSLPTNGEQEWYINSNDPATSSVVPWSVSDGILTITAAPASSTISPLIDNYQYTSGELNTYSSFSQTYGYFEMRAELPSGQGMWPAFWMLPENGAWPPELDAMEVLGNNPSELYTTVHSEVNGSEVSTGVGTLVANTSTAYHTYAVDWTASTITWYFDGQEVYQVATPADMNTAMFMELNLAVGGTWPGDVNSSTTLPAEMRVAYVDVYSSDPNPITTTTTFTASGKAGQVLLGAPGNDIFYAGTSSVIMTGDGETNTYIYNALPTHFSQITDFDPGTDSVNIAGLLQSVGYTGTNPFGAKVLRIVQGANGSFLEYKSSSETTWTKIVEFDNVAASAIETSTDFIVTAGFTPGETLFAQDTAGQVLAATTPNDTFYAEQSSVIMTADGGTNSFVFTALPYNAAQITNFNPSMDTVNVATMLQSLGYAGTNPFADGTLTLSSDGHGGTDLYYHQTSTSTPITIVDLENVAVSSLSKQTDFVTSISGDSAKVASPATLTANDTAGQMLTATTPNETFYAEQNSVIMTEDGGSNSFVFTALPYNAGQITNFNVAGDTINVSAMLQAEGYTGTNPFGDGTLTLTSDGNGGTDLYYHQSTTSIAIKIIDLDHVAESSINPSADFIFT